MDIIGTIIMGFVALIIYYWKDAQIFKIKLDYDFEKTKNEALLEVLKAHGIIVVNKNE